MGTLFIQVFFLNQWCDGGVIFFHQSQTRWCYYSITWGQPQKRSDSLPHIHCLLVDMKYQGLIDVKDKQFGAPLHFDWQPSMLFFCGTLCHHDKWRDVMHEIWLLPKRTMTGWPQILGDDWQWNQVVRCNRYRRTSYCHHCHWLLVHRLSMSDTSVLLFNQIVHWIYSHFVYVYTDWHDGGKVPWAHQPRQADEWRHCLFDRTVQIQIDRISSGHATGYDWATLTSLPHVRESNDTFGQDI